MHSNNQASPTPLCPWPCRCYSRHALDQAADGRAEICERSVAAHGVIILASTCGYQSPSPLKLMTDRRVCADGGNPDPTTTHGKPVAEAKRSERQGWAQPKHVAGRAHGVVVHTDVAGVETHRRNLTDWLEWMGLIDAGPAAKLDRDSGDSAPCDNSHEALDKDKAVQAEARNVARSGIQAVKQLRAGPLSPPDRQVKWPRQK